MWDTAAVNLFIRNLVSFVVVAVITGCSGSGGGTPASDGGTNANTNTNTDAGVSASSDAGMDAGTDAGTGDQPEDLASVLDPIRDQNDLPALAAAVFSSEETLAIGAVGVRKHGDPTQATTADKWHLGSNTKAMTATLAALLVEEGKLDWNSTAGEVFSTWSADMDPGYRDVTLEMLLGHRGGAPANPPTEVWNAMWQPGEPVQIRRTAVQTMLAQPPAVMPGTQVLYSNSGYMIAGAMLEQVTGSAWEKLVQEKLFAPLDMSSCGFGAPASAGQVDQPWGHQVVSGQLQPVPPKPAGDNPPALGPAGTVHCSLEDYGKFLTLHLRAARGSASLLTLASFDRLHAPVMADAALGWFAVSRSWSGGVALMHSGSNTMNLVTVWIAPTKDRALVVATNRGDATATGAVDAALAPLIQTWIP